MYHSGPLFVRRVIYSHPTSTLFSPRVTVINMPVSHLIFRRFARVSVHDCMVAPELVPSVPSICSNLGQVEFTLDPHRCRPERQAPDAQGREIRGEYKKSSVVSRTHGYNGGG